MSIQRWDPFRDVVTLREAMNSLLEESLVRPRVGMAALTGGMLIDLSESPEVFTIRTTLPGAKPEDVDISVLGDTLRISAEIRPDDEREGESWLVRERRFGRFERSLTLPGNVKADEAQADFSDGILTIILPKAEATLPRQIQVRSSANQQGRPSEEIEIESSTSQDATGDSGGEHE